ncbi:PD40 domain-containing protein [Ectothiorhodospiraceae bacterium WFHF3C12]|nr:PD40 domain-containing protein [Ectothiorhodospiraceae bacterium WFHF3C12]
MQRPALTRNSILAVAVLPAFAGLAACGGGGGGGGGGSTASGNTTDDVVVFEADTTTDGWNELWRAGFDGGPVMVTAPRAVDGDVTTVRRSPGGDRIAFLMRNAGSSTPELLYTADVRSNDPPVLVSNNAESAGADVTRFAWSPNGDRLAFIAETGTNGTSELFIAFPDGSGRATITSSAAMGTGKKLEWAPDSSQLAYVAEDLELFVVSPDTPGQTTRVSEDYGNGGGRSVVGFAWAPDSGAIAYMADQDTVGRQELYVAAPDGTGDTAVNESMVSGGDVLSFAWAPDAGRLAYKADADTDGIEELFTVDPDGNAHAKVHAAYGSGNDIVDYQWSPDGAYLAYLAQQDDPGQEELYASAADGSGNVRLNSTSMASDVLNYAWAPDSSRVAYSVFDGGAAILAASSLHTVRPDGSGRAQVNGPLASNGNVFTFKWAPSGGRIAYVAEQDTVDVRELYTTAGDGNDGHKVNADPGGNGDVLSNTLDWSSDGSRIAYVGDTRTAGVAELFSASPDGSDRVRISPDLSLADSDVTELHEDNR